MSKKSQTSTLRQYKRTSGNGFNSKKKSSRVGAITHVQSEWDLLNGKKKKFAASLSIIFSRDQRMIQALIRTYLNEFKHLSTHHGEQFAIKRMKVYLSNAERFASHVKFTPPAYTSLDDASLPKFLWIFRNLLASETSSDKQLALTILSLGRIYECDVKTYDVSSVVKTHSTNLHKSRYVGHFFRQLQHHELKTHDFGVSWRKVLRRLFPASGLSDRKRDLKDLSDLHVTGRNGPNGHSLSAAYRDYIALLRDQEMGGSLLNDVKDLASLVGYDNLLGHLEEFPTDEKFQRIKQDEVDNGISHYHSVLNLKRGEPWWKERIFASVDFFSQSSLLSIQKWISRFLKQQSFACDGSTDQSKVIETCRKWTEYTFPYSKDLTTATDSIPIELLTELVISMFGEKIGRAWQKVMSDRFFHDKINNNDVKYVTGNPMGAYTSWHLLHMFQISLYLTIEDYLGLPVSFLSDSTNFVVVGDDSATLNREISHIYDIVISDLCGVSQSPLKGYNPDVSELESYKVCEMCKRILVNGNDISPISPRVLLDGIRDPSTFPNMMLHITERCLHITNANEIQALLSAKTNHPLKTLKIITNPLICPEGLDPNWFSRQDMKSHVKFINSIEYDQFHMQYITHALAEINLRKVRIHQWVIDTYMGIFDPLDDPNIFPTNLAQVHLDCQLALLEDVLGQVTAMLIDMDENIFPIGYQQSIDNSPIGVRSVIVKKMVQHLLMLDNFPSYLGYGHDKRDERGKKFATEFTKLGLKTLDSIYNKVEFPMEYTSSVFTALNEILTTPVLCYTQELGLKILSSANFGYIITHYFGLPEGEPQS
jgi:hypothetical protein